MAERERSINLELNWMEIDQILRALWAVEEITIYHRPPEQAVMTKFKGLRDKLEYAHRILTPPKADATEGEG